MALKKASEICIDDRIDLFVGNIKTVIGVKRSGNNIIVNYSDCSLYSSFRDTTELIDNCDGFWVLKKGQED